MISNTDARSRLTRRRWLSLAGAGVLAASARSAPALAAAGPDIRVACLGDSMIDGVWGALTRLATREACLKPRLDFGRFGENGTGLTRADRYDWPGEAAKIVERFKPDLVIVSLGLNDRQTVVDLKSKKRAAYGAPEWESLYQAQVAEFLRNAAHAPAGLLWLGVPALRDTAAQADAREKNRIYAGAVRALGDPRIDFVEPWRPAGVEAETFAAYGPDAGGARIQLRSPDGIHFTAAGYDLIAAYLLPKILARLKAAGGDIPYPCP